MSIMELGAIGEFLGSIAVVATLVYLAIQVRQNTRSMEVGQRVSMTANYIARVNQIEQSTRAFALSDQLPDIVDRGETQGIGSLTAVEGRRYFAWYMAQYHRVDSQFYQLQQGLLDEEGRLAFEKIVLRSASRWADLNILEHARPSFREEVDRILARDKPT